MDEKVLIRSEQYDTKKGILIAILILTIFALIVTFMVASDRYSEYDVMLYNKCLLECDPDSEDSEAHSYICAAEGECILWQYSSASAYAWAKAFARLWDSYMGIIFVGYLGCILLIYLASLWLKSYELTVTDKRVYGKVAWGKRVDLPLDSIAAISTVIILKGIATSTPSGAIRFLLVKNADQIYQILIRLLIERQNRVSTQTIIAANQRNAEEIK